MTEKEQPLEYVPIHTDLPGHRKTKRLARLLPGAPLPVHMFLQELFRETGLRYPTGEYPSDFESPDVADLANWPGDSVLWTSALTDAGWLERADGRWRIVNWREYGGKAIERRVKDKIRKRNERAGAQAPPDDCPNVSDGHPQDVREKPPDKADTHGNPCDSTYREEEEERVKISSSSSSFADEREISADALNRALLNWGWRQKAFPPKHWPNLLANAPYSQREIDSARDTVDQKPHADRSPGLLLKVILDERRDAALPATPKRARRKSNAEIMDEVGERLAREYEAMEAQENAGE